MRIGAQLRRGGGNEHQSLLRIGKIHNLQTSRAKRFYFRHLGSQAPPRVFSYILPEKRPIISRSDDDHSACSIFVQERT
jgi:hypothetical protein